MKSQQNSVKYASVIDSAIITYVVFCAKFNKSCGYVNSQANFNMPCGHLRIYVDGKDQLWTKTKYVGFQGKCPHTQV